MIVIFRMHFLWLVLFLSGCAVNPATGEQSFTLFMSPAEEQRIGAQEHSKILDRFGGVYDDVNVTGYVAELGGRLSANARVQNTQFRFTVLNSPEVNAFALPGGYVYVTRGLIAIANSEAELAGVIAHEIGHVAARHNAERYSRAVVASLGAAILGAVTNTQIGQFANLGSELYLASFSREQEFQADSLGVRYLRSTGYAPSGMASFLKTLNAEAALQAKLMDASAGDLGSNMFATHPRTLDRVERAIAEAGGAQGVVRREELLNVVAGLLYGDDPAQGVIRARSFIHPDFRFRFDAPQGFRLFNTNEAVLARDSSGAAIIFDSAGRQTHPDPFVYLRDIWAYGTRLDDLQRIEINGMEAATGTTQIQGKIGDYSGRLDARLVAIQFGPREIYRFMFLNPPGRSRSLRDPFRRVTFSFRRLSEQEANDVVPLTIEILRVGPRDTVQSLASGLPFEDFQIDRFLVLNGLQPGEFLSPGTRIKIIAE